MVDFHGFTATLVANVRRDDEIQAIAKEIADLWCDAKYGCKWAHDPRVTLGEQVLFETPPLEGWGRKVFILNESGQSWQLDVHAANVHGALVLVPALPKGQEKPMAECLRTGKFPKDFPRDGEEIKGEAICCYGWSGGKPLARLVEIAFRFERVCIG